MKGRKSFLLRLEPEVFRAVEEWAQQEMRSVNGQVEWILKEACERRLKKPLTGPTVVGAETGRPVEPSQDENGGEEPVPHRKPIPSLSSAEPLELPPEMTGVAPLPEFDGYSYGDPTLPIILPDLTRDLEPPPSVG